MKTVIEMAREAGFTDAWLKPLERFAALVREDEREKLKQCFDNGTPKALWSTARILAELEEWK